MKTKKFDPEKLREDRKKRGYVLSEEQRKIAEELPDIEDLLIPEQPPEQPVQ